MIDEKTLAEDEREQKMLADHYANKPEMVVTFKKRIADDSKDAGRPGKSSGYFLAHGKP